MTGSLPLPGTADAVVIGSGFAGLSAAVRLAEAGRRVVVVEEAPRLGGRASSFVDRETGERVDNGQHVLFGCYSSTYDFLRKIGAAHLAPLQRRLTLAMASDDGLAATLACPDLPAPWHLFAGLMRWKALGWADRLSALRLGGWLRRVASRPRGAENAAAAVPANATVSDWLHARGQSATLRDWLWHPLAIAALNQSPGLAAARPFVRVLAELFASDPAAATIGLASVPLDDLFAVPSVRFIEARGGSVIAKVRGRVIVDDSGRLAGARIGGALVTAPVVISAVPWHGLSRLWDQAPPPALAQLQANAGAMTSSPIVTANLWVDPPLGNALPFPFVGFVNGPMHWLFNKARVFGSGARHLSVVASGADAIARQENAQIADAAFAQIQRALPALRTRRLLRAVIVREPRATFSLAPGGPPRPANVTPLDGFFLAGDWTDTGLPGTIEGAVRSGHAAADAAMAGR